MCIVHPSSAVCLLHPSASMQANGFKYGVVSRWPLPLGFVSLGAKACSRRGCVLRGRHGPRCQDTAHTEDTQVYKIRQMKGYCYSNGLAKYLASRQLNKPLQDMATELRVPLYFSLQCYAHILSLLTTIPSAHKGMKTNRLPDPFLRSNEQKPGYGSPLTGSGDALGACPA